MTVLNFIKRLIALGILLAFAYFVEVLIGWQRLLVPWLYMPTGVFISAIILVFVSYWVRTLRLYDYFRGEMRGHFLLSMRLMLQHNFLNNMMPMRTGELSFPVLMLRYFALPFARSLPALAWFRFLDLCALAFSAVVVGGQYWLGWPSAIMLSLLLLIIPRLVYESLHHWRGDFVPSSTRGWRKLLAHLLHGLPATPGQFWRSWFWSLANWLVKLVVFAWILSYFLTMPPAAAWIGSVGGDLSSVLPVHGVAGAGTYEAGVVAGLMLFRLNPEAALLAAVNLHLFVLAATLGGGALSLLLPKSRKTH